VIGFDFLKCETWPNQKPEVDFGRYCRHLGKSIWRQNSGVRFEWNWAFP